AGMEVEYLGIPFDSQGIATLNRNLFVSIAGWIEGPVWVGEYGGKDLEKILEISESYGLNFWQVQDLELAKDLKKKGFQVAFELNSLEPETVKTVLEEIKPVFMVIRMDRSSVPSENGLSAICGMGQVLVHPISTVEDVEFWKAQAPTIGLQLVSGEEDRPGWMDLSGLQDVLEYLEMENH
ncbi:MAG TPA: hypothetical protein PKY12_15315, partial [Catalimonadaceae bacterium]|nr:hypothetical protein [Catalimonadaceae bacterium]